MPVMCLMSFSLRSSRVMKTLGELQLKFHCRALVNFVIRLRFNTMVIGLCCARIKGHGSSSARALSPRSMDDNDDRLADSSKTCSSIDEMRLLYKVSVSS